jgi:hypothetical protein
MLKIFLISYFEYCQINCLDIFMDDQYLNNIMKFEKQIIDCNEVGGMNKLWLFHIFFGLKILFQHI